MLVFPPTFTDSKVLLFVNLLCMGQCIFLFPMTFSSTSCSDFRIELKIDFKAQHRAKRKRYSFESSIDSLHGLFLGPGALYCWDAVGNRHLLMCQHGTCSRAEGCCYVAGFGAACHTLHPNQLHLSNRLSKIRTDRSRTTRRRRRVDLNDAVPTLTWRERRSCQVAPARA